MSAKETIHSGHFMTSNPHTEIQGEDEDEDVEVDVVDVEDGTIGQDDEKGVGGARISGKGEKPSTTTQTYYKFGPHKAQSIAIDVSLNKLNKCIRVAYMKSTGNKEPHVKMTTPKWKDFKGLKLQWKHRIRLNNVIWRAYYMEFRKANRKRKTPFCYFSVPDDDTTHTKVEGCVLEGMYWKRRMEAVCAQYKRWRTYNRHVKKRDRVCCRKRELRNSCACEYPTITDQTGSRPPQSQTPTGYSTFEDLFDADDDFDNEFTNQLFESLNAPFLFPCPKDSVQNGNANDLSIFQQPGLLPLQPSMEDIMFGGMSSSDCYFPEEEQPGLTQPPAYGSISGGGNARYADIKPTSSSLCSSGREMGNLAPLTSQHHVVSTAASSEHLSTAQQVGGYSAKEYDAAMQLAVGFDSSGPTVQQRQEPLYSQAPQFNKERENALEGLTNSSRVRKAPIMDDTPPAFTPKRTTITSSSFDSDLGSVGSSLSLMGSLDHYVPRILAAVSAATPATGIQSLSRSTPYASQPTLTALQPQPSSVSSNNQWLLDNLQQHNQQQIQQRQRQLQLEAAANAVATDKLLLAYQQSTSPILGLGGQTYAAIQTTTNHQRRHSNKTGVIGGLVASTSAGSGYPPPQAIECEGASGGMIQPHHVVGAIINAQSRTALDHDLSTRGGVIPPQYLPQQNIGAAVGADAAFSSMPNSVVMPQAVSSASMNGDELATTKRTANQQQLYQVRAPHRLPPVVGTRRGSSSELLMEAPRKPAINNNGNHNPAFLFQQHTPLMGSSTVQTVKSSQVFVTRNLLTTSCAGPTAPSASIGNIYVAMAKDGPVPTIHSPFAPTLPPLNVGKTASTPSPTRAPATRGAFRFSSADNLVSPVSTPFTGGSSASVGRVPPPHPLFLPPSIQQLAGGTSKHQLRSPTLSQQPTLGASFLSAAADEKPVAAKLRRKDSSSMAGVVGRPSDPIYIPLTPPSQYEGSGPVNVLASPDGSVEAARELSSPSSGGAPSSTASTSNPQLGSPSNLLQLAGRVLIKEEQHDVEGKSSVLSSRYSNLPTLPSGSKRRNTATSGSRASARAAADSTLHPDERKRILHLHAEKNRRSALKEGFESLLDAIPMVEQAGVKSTNAVVLNRAAIYIRDLKEEEEEKARQVEQMLAKIERTNEKINTIQANLPSNSRLTSPPSSANASSMKCQLGQFFEHYSKERAKEDYRFWMMSEIFQKLVQSFSTNVHHDPSNREEVLASARRWLDGSWNSATLRPACTDTLVRLATGSGTINDDASLPNFIMSEVAKFASGSTSSTSSSLSHQKS